MTAVAATGCGRFLPETVVTNDDLATRLDTSDEWIVERTGIRSRRVGGTTVGNATEAARRALADAGRSADELGLIVVATTTPDRVVPPTATEVAEHLDVQCGAFDLSATCAGFVYGVVVAGELCARLRQPGVVVGADAITRIVDPADRSVGVLFGDGAGAVVLEPTDGEAGLLGWSMRTEPCAEILKCELGGYVSMNGQELFYKAIHAAEESALAALKEAGLEAGDVDLFVPHQANTRIIDALARRVGIESDKVVSVIEHTGNTSAASIPIGLCAAAGDGRLRPGAVVLMTAFGGGMTLASAVLRWGER